jgi:hypothetical protein
MSDDNRDFLDRINSSSENWTGKPRTPDDVVGEFHLHGPQKRIEALEQLDAEFAAADTSDLRKFHDLARMRRQMKEIHHTLRKANR